MSTKQQSTPIAASVDQPSGTSDSEEWHDDESERLAQRLAEKGTDEVEQAQDQGAVDTKKKTAEEWEKTPPLFDSLVSGWLQQAEQELYQAAIEKVRGEQHWRIKHFQTKRYIYDVYPDWRIARPVSFWEAILCSCPTGYVRGAPCEHKAMVRVWCVRHRGAEGVKGLLDRPI